MRGVEVLLFSLAVVIMPAAAEAQVEVGHSAAESMAGHLVEQSIAAGLHALPVDELHDCSVAYFALADLAKARGKFSREAEMRSASSLFSQALFLKVVPEDALLAGKDTELYKELSNEPKFDKFSALVKAKVAECYDYKSTVAGQVAVFMQNVESR